MIDMTASKISSKIKEDTRSRAFAYSLFAAFAIYVCMRLSELGLYSFNKHDMWMGVVIFAIYGVVCMKTASLIADCQFNILESTNDAQVALYHLQQLSLVGRKEENTMYVGLIIMFFIGMPKNVLYEVFSSHGEIIRMTGGLLFSIVIPLFGLGVALREKAKISRCKYSKLPTGKGYTNADGLQP